MLFFCLSCVIDLFLRVRRVICLVAERFIGFEVLLFVNSFQHLDIFFSMLTSFSGAMDFVYFSVKEAIFFLHFLFEKVFEFVKVGVICKSFALRVI